MLFYFHALKGPLIIVQVCAPFQGFSFPQYPWYPSSSHHSKHVILLQRRGRARLALVVFKLIQENICFPLVANKTLFNLIVSNCFLFSVTDVRRWASCSNILYIKPCLWGQGKIYFWLLCWWTVNFFWLENSQRFYSHHSHHQVSNKYLSETWITPKELILQYISIYFIHKCPNFEKLSMKVNLQKCWSHEFSILIQYKHKSNVKNCQRFCLHYFSMSLFVWWRLDFRSLLGAAKKRSSWKNCLEFVKQRAFPQEDLRKPFIILSCTDTKTTMGYYMFLVFIYSRMCIFLLNISD